jgi:hypothetical protein
MTTIATLLLTLAPPPFQWEWPAVREHWPHVSVELEASVQVGALVGGLIGDIDPRWLVATAFVESSFRPEVVGDRGTSFGLCQLKRRTARGAWSVATTELLLDPVVNLTVAGAVYRRIIAKYGRTRAQQVYGCGMRKCGLTKGAKAKWMWFRRVSRGAVLENDT